MCASVKTEVLDSKVWSRLAIWHQAFPKVKA